MRIATFNINGVNTRLANLLDWLKAEAPDIACLQELKATARQFPEVAIREAGYDAVWEGEHRWNGVAILSRVGAPVVTRRSLPGDPADRQSRYLEAAVQGVLVGCLYLPNGNPRPGPKFDYKLAWMERLIAHAAGLVTVDAPVVLCGDYNVVPTEADIYDSRSWKANALLQPESRAGFARLLDQGWTDALRERFPEQPPWTFWQYLREAWARDAGLRIDHLLLNPRAAARLKDAGVDAAVRGRERASDHAPAWIELADTDPA
ncbi:exodeoxyribonuclease III [Brevundimonas goettingensis]|uniref:Exodeoxyribonuclease III n=1 Tax=Brevundimonas goettingensis TaxID=2774190 RepID=A0A975GZM5_9CAUL|nr:exodeoxyribonuclease III [Brevundimonas goettingensis]QTC92800.1 exodeoxyribonuclease III [Brevundimonas goettingensis]